MIASIGDAVDDAHNGREPCGRHIWIEGDPHGERNRETRSLASEKKNEIADFGRKDLLKSPGGCQLQRTTDGANFRDWIGPDACPPAADAQDPRPRPNIKERMKVGEIEQR